MADAQSESSETRSADQRAILPTPGYGSNLRLSEGGMVRWQTALATHDGPRLGSLGSRQYSHGTGGTVTRFYSIQEIPKRFFKPVRE